MKCMQIITIICMCILATFLSLQAQNAHYDALHAHFERMAMARFDTLFDSVGDLKNWEKRKEISRRRLCNMLWHKLEWPSSPPTVEITGRIERSDYTIECLVIETLPDIYSTTNLYLPHRGNGPYPAVLYQCGHQNKKVFKHHGAWFAARGIAVAMMDNIEMGELEFTHHGIYSHAWWHWYSRGFSPMAAELLNARRTLDYLCTRPDINPELIGATGVSGGGMATFFLSAVDERVKAAAPVSGSFSTAGWVKHLRSSAHCDCQYPVNSYGLSYSEIGALTAPRTQLICNADADRGFPMDSFNEMVEKMSEIYSLYDAKGHLRTAVVPGGHGDNEVIRLPVYAFFLKEFLGVDTTITEQGPVDTPPNSELDCFKKGFPLNERLSRIDQVIAMPYQVRSEEKLNESARQRRIEELIRQLEKEVFRYFPRVHTPFDPQWSEKKPLRGRTVREVNFNSFPDLRVRGRYSLPSSVKAGKLPAVLVLDHRRGIPVWGNKQEFEGYRWGELAVMVVETLDRGLRAVENNLRSFQDDDPRHHLKREAMVMGTTFESMEVYEVLRSLQFLRSQPQVDPERITILGRGEVGINGLYAGLLDSTVERVILDSPPASHLQGPCYLGILRYTDIPEVVMLMRDKVRLYGEIPLALKTFLADQELDKTIFTGSLVDCLR